MSAVSDTIAIQDVGRGIFDSITRSRHVNWDHRISNCRAISSDEINYQLTCRKP